MSRAALNSHDRESFIKSQINSCHKALNKQEAPLKQKHARVLIVGTHKERSATVFWNTISHIALEKNPIVTWKFCHLLHKLIRDGHRNVATDSYRFKNRLVQLGNFWQHLRTSGYGGSNYSYCNALVKRLEFHHRYGSIPGSFQLTPAQIDVLSQDVNEAFELAIELLDQLDSLLELKNSVTSTMDSLRWSSLILPGQCLLAPLVLVIIDTSKIYDITVKLLFKLHSQLSADVLAGHRSRFNTAYRGLKKFYDDAAGLQYFQYLVSITTLPADPPNFLNANGLDTYQTPQAYLHNEGSSEGGDTPPDSRSMADDNLIVDLDFAQPVEAPAMSFPTKDQKDMQIEDLQMENQRCRDDRERILAEAKNRIEAYESSLQSLNTDRDYWKDRHIELQEENQRLRVSMEQNLQSSQADEQLKKKMVDTEEQYQKLRTAYSTFRAEHLQALREITELKKRIKELEEEKLQQAEEIRKLKQQLLEAEQALEELTAIKNLTAGDIDADQLGVELESEMDRVNKAILDAVQMLEALQKRSRENATGVRLEVNDKILDACNDLIAAIRILVIRSRDVQEEIVQQGKGTASPKEFYKHNHQWTEGLLSAAKAVGGAATYLVQCADGVVSKNGKFENIIIAAQEVAASVAQLYVSSRVKADRDSKKMAELSTASKTVNKCTASVVATVKSGQLDLSDTALDFTNLSLHEAKKQEMDSQIRTLELEAELERERIRLAGLRKKHYHLASLVSQENGEDRQESSTPASDAIIISSILSSEGRECMNAGRHYEAIEKLSLAVELYPAPVHFYNRAVVYMSLKRYNDAINDYRAAIHLDPMCGVAYAGLRCLFTSQKRYEEAIELYKKALEINPENEQYKGNLATVEEKLKAVNQESTTLSSDVIEKANDLKEEGSEYMKAMKYKEAIEKYTQAISLNRDPIYLCNRAAAFCRLKQYNEAESDCYNALLLDRNYAKAHGRLGFIKSCKGLYFYSIKSYKNALQLDPTNESYKENHALAEAKLRETNQGQ